MKNDLEKTHVHRTSAKARLRCWCASALIAFASGSAFAQTNTIPLFQFAIFYNSLLEFTWCAPMTVNGRVHSDGEIYTGSQSQLTFNSFVSTAGTISSPDWFGKSHTDYSKPTIYNQTWISNASPMTPFIGTSNSPDALREMINPPPPGEDPNSPVGQWRYYNKAGIVLLVSDSNITAIIRSPTDGTTNVIKANYYPTNNYASNYSQIVSNFPFLSVTNYWWTNPVPVKDQRENDILKLTDIDISLLRKWLTNRSEVNVKFPNIAGVYPSQATAPNILYVADNRTYNNGQLTAIRLRNATNLPPNYFSFYGTNFPSGFTLATPNPLYIYGHYNAPDPSQRGTTNTSAAYPASLVCDALTILSPNWQDSKSAYTLPSSSSGASYNGKNAAVSTTINAAILTGIVYSTGPEVTNFSGGVHNLPRLLEDWGNGSAAIKLTLNTSIVNLYNSARATNQYQAPGVYYYAPTRQFSFDPNFLLPWRLPPGTPEVGPAAPRITEEPQGRIALASDTTELSVSNNGATPLSYQWVYNGTNIIDGATNSSLVLSNIQPEDAGSYTVLVTNIYGAATSAVAELTVAVGPALDPPLANVTLLAGQSTAFSASATGTAPFAYQWQFNGANLDGATDASLALTNVSLDLAGTYSVLVSNLAGATTNSATLTVYATAAATLTSLPSLSGDQFHFSVSGVPGFSYVIEASTNFIDWEPLITNTSPFTLTDDQITNYPARFYRSVYAP